MAEAISRDSRVRGSAVISARSSRTASSSEGIFADIQQGLRLRRHPEPQTLITP